MKYLHLSTGDVRGAFTGAYRLHENLKSAGHESKMFVRMKNSKDPDVISPPKFIQLAAKIISKIFKAIIMRICSNRNEFHKRYFFPYWGMVDLKYLYSNITFEPDLIIVYYVADFLSADDLCSIQKHYKAAIAFYLMDAGMLTGGCHYPWDCEGFVNKCSNCPIFRISGINDWPGKIWSDRHSAFYRINYSIIAGSSWLYNMTEKSSLHVNKRIDKVLMGIDSKMFTPRDKLLSRTELGIPDTSEHTIVIYFGAQFIDEQRKGFSYLFSALELLQAQLSDDLLNKLLLLTVGAKKPSSLKSLQIKHHHIEYLHDKVSFAKTYNAADIFICPSVEDAGPMMINEAVMSGTPVIAFRMGVAEDLIFDGESGYIADNFNSKDLATKISKLVGMDKADRFEMSVKCRRIALELTSQQVQVQHIVSLTDELKMISA